MCVCVVEHRVGIWVQNTVSFSRDTALSVQVSLYDGSNPALREGGIPFTWTTTFEEVLIPLTNQTQQKLCFLVAFSFGDDGVYHMIDSISLCVGIGGVVGC